VPGLDRHEAAEPVPQYKHRDEAQHAAGGTDDDACPSESIAAQRPKPEALRIRNKLLLFRLRNLGKRKTVASLVDRTIEPRLNQIFVPLLSIIEDDSAKDALRELARRYNRETILDRGMDMDAQVLETIRDLHVSSVDGKVSMKEIASWFVDKHGEEYDRKVTAKWIGSIVRKKLGIKTERGRDGYAIAATKKSKIQRLYERYGIETGNTHESADSGWPLL
jgi:hypothetical protein